MNRIIKHISYAWVMLLTLCFSSCADQTFVDDKPQGEGTLLNMYASINKVNTRLAELGGSDVMNENSGLKNYKHIGLYIYYEDDYKKAGDLSKPYIRNLECEVKDGALTPISGEKIYIYDRMTIVAFYPYNEAMNEEANYFTKLSDEKAYPISESDYINQKYIPYRAETNVNPTNAYMIQLGFSPQHTSKVEVVLTADDPNNFPTGTSLTDGKVKLLPNVDKLAGSYTPGEDRRENWVDGIADFPAQGTQPVGGKYVRRYTAYVWKSAALADDAPHHDNYTHEDNILKKGEILFESDELTLIVPATVNLSEQVVYRYGYNLDNGEIFIPTSDKLIYDATSLQDAKFDDYHAYQVCDIDLSKLTDAWKPLTTNNGTYNGGGHAIKNLKIEATPTVNVGNDYAKQMFGLFSDVMGTSTLMNINLVDPTITIDYSNIQLTDTCYVGAICGLVNPELSEDAMRQRIFDSLPKELSTTVKLALVEEQMKKMGNTTCTIRGCKVTNPTIIVTGNNVHVGGLVGGAGNLKQKAEIKDSYTTGGNIAVNAKDVVTQAAYEFASVGAFCGTLANGSFTNCYSNIENISGYAKDGIGSSKNIAAGFVNLLATDKLPQGATTTVTSCFSQKTDANTTAFSRGWPNWPLFKDDPKATNNSLSGQYGGNPWPCYKWEDSWKDMGTQPSAYPTLIWETPFTVENK